MSIAESEPELDLDFSRRGQEPVRALDELFHHARLYRSGKSFHALVSFIAKFRQYKPFNAMLINVQMPGATFVGTPSFWHTLKRHVDPTARPLVILRPKGPIMFVFDVSQVTADPHAPDMPKEISDPFRVDGWPIDPRKYALLLRNAQRDGIEVIDQTAGSQQAGQVTSVPQGRQMRITVRSRPKPTYIYVPVKYQVALNSQHTPTQKFVTLTHELGHLYCGHLGTVNPLYWSDRSGVQDHSVREFEAESVSYLVSTRLGIQGTSDAYLSGYLHSDDDVPPIDLDTVLKAAGLIESMTERWLGARKVETTV